MVKARAREDSREGKRGKGGGGGASGVVNEDFELAMLGFDMGGCGRDEGGKGYIELEGDRAADVDVGVVGLRWAWWALERCGWR